MVTVAGWEERRDENGRRVSTGQAKDYEVAIWDRFEAVKSVTRPYAYIYPAEMTWLTEILQRHGLEVEELREDIELDVEVYTVNAVSRAERPFQGHNLATVEVGAADASRWYEAGTIVVRTAQDLGNLAVYLLEPECEDGLTTWNFFDEHLEEGGAFPVARIKQRTRMTTGAVRKLAEDRESGKRITWEARYDDRDLPSFNGSPIRVRRWIDDEHFLLSQDGDTWKVHATTGRSAVYAPTGDMASALAKLPTITTEQAERLTRRADDRWNPDLPGMVFDHENDLYFCDWEGTEAVRLTSTPGVEELDQLDPSGRFVAFVRENDLYVVDIQTQTERALTTGGTDILRNGKAGWVYFEEVFGRNWRTFWWAPDGTHIAFLETDSSRVPEFIITDNWRHEQRVEMTRYPKPGDPNPDVRLGIVSSAGGSVRWVDMSDYQPGHLITGVNWTPDSETVRFYVQDRAQTWLDICDVGTNGGTPSLWLRDTTEAWIDQPATMQVLSDSSVLMSSERSGWMHLYHYSPRGELKTQVTEGEWEARRVHHVDEKGGWVYLSGTKDSHTGSNLYRARMDGSGVQRLTTGKGSHSIELSPDGSMFVDSVSSFKTPATTTLYATTSQAGANAIRTLDTNPVYALEEYELGKMEVYTIETEDGFPLEGYTIKPPDFDPSRSYPVWFMTYAGPHAPTVRDSWRGARVHEQMLASMGYVVFRTDPRSASGRGAVSAWSAYKRLGEQEMADIRDAIEWLTAHDWVDGTRVGMSGHSYGGFMTAYALTHSDLFAAGIAGAPVTDWREYDTIYTERYMQTPSANVDGYERTSVIEAAKDLKGRLLILHGDIDDNVHEQNTTRLVRALQQADREFELMIYPGYRHGIFGMHYQKLVVDFMNRTLRPGPDD
jgi:dipeptidyl aminopeptidase/acylaminoacyl peptidase